MSLFNLIRLPFGSRLPESGVALSNTRPFEKLILDSLVAEPSKWFLDHGANAHTLRAVNRERGVAVSVSGVFTLGNDRVFASGDAVAKCGRAPLTPAFAAQFRAWAVAEFNRRAGLDEAVELERIEKAVTEAFRNPS